MALKSILTLSSHLCRGLPKGLFLPRLPTKTLYAFLDSSMVPEFAMKYLSLGRPLKMIYNAFYNNNVFNSVFFWSQNNKLLNCWDPNREFLALQHNAFAIGVNALKSNTILVFAIFKFSRLCSFFWYIISID